MEIIKIETALTTFDVTEAVLADLESSTKMTIADAESEKVVRKYRQQAKSLQVQIEKRRLKLNREYKERTDKAAEILTTRINPVYDDLDGKIKAVEADREAKRLEREAAEKAERERLEKIEAERLAKIEAALSEVTTAAKAGQGYNLPASEIKMLHHALNNLEISEDVFQERHQEAMAIWKKGLEDTHTALIAREKFEQEQAAQEAEKKRLAEERANFEAEQKAAREKAEAAEKAERDRRQAEERERQKIEAEKAEKARQEQERLRLEREALEKEKAEILAAKQAEEDRKKAAAQYDLDWDAALLEDAEWERARKEKQRADKARAKLINVDKELLAGFIQKIEMPFFEVAELQTDSGNAVFSRFATAIDNAVSNFKSDIEAMS